jgi:hypothetical protein
MIVPIIGALVLIYFAVQDSQEGSNSMGRIRRGWLADVSLDWRVVVPLVDGQTELCCACPTSIFLRTVPFVLQCTQMAQSSCHF